MSGESFIGIIWKTIFSREYLKEYGVVRELYLLYLGHTINAIVTEFCKVLQLQINKRFPQNGTGNFMFGFPGLNC